MTTPISVFLHRENWVLQRGRGREPDNQRESPKARGIAGHIEKAERGAIRKSPQAHKQVCPLLPTAMVFVSNGFVLVQVRVQVQVACAPSRLRVILSAVRLPAPGAGLCVAFRCGCGLAFRVSTWLCGFSSDFSTAFLPLFCRFPGLL